MKKDFQKSSGGPLVAEVRKILEGLRAVASLDESEARVVAGAGGLEKALAAGTVVFVPVSVYAATNEAVTEEKLKLLKAELKPKNPHLHDLKRAGTSSVEVVIASYSVVIAKPRKTLTRPKSF